MTRDQKRHENEVIACTSALLQSQIEATKALRDDAATEGIGGSGGIGGIPLLTRALNKILADGDRGTPILGQLQGITVTLRWALRHALGNPIRADLW